MTEIDLFKYNIDRKPDLPHRIKHVKSSGGLKFKSMKLVIVSYRQTFQFIDFALRCKIVH